MAELLLVKTMGPSLRAADPEAEVAIKALAAGEVVRARVTKPRNGRFHRRFFAMLSLVFENQEAFTDREQFRKACLIEAGYYTDVKLLDGTVSREAQSMSFTAMDELTFRQVYNAVVNVILAKVLPGMDFETLESEVEQQMMGFL